tara:strand:+ start:2009 stop:2329 length:321 start_codon:yes stop_codon:yes gene_type:complete
MSRIKKNYFLLICTFLILYFFFNLIDGERGLVSYLEKKEKLELLKLNEIYYTNEINDLENKNILLSDKLDKDFVEILIREKFLFGKKNEQIYIIKNNESKASRKNK